MRATIIKETTATAISARNESIEKIEVLGQRPVAHFKREMYQAQKLFLKNYNNLTTEKKFKTKCFYYMPAGTRLRERTCEARFQRAKLSVMTRDAPLAGWRGPLRADGGVALRDTLKEYQQDMIKVVLANPELRKQLSAYATSVALFRKKHQEKLDESWAWN